MVTTDTDGKRRQGRGEEGMKEVGYAAEVCRVRREENEIEVGERDRTPVLHRGRRIMAPKSGSLRSLINTAARFPASYSVPWSCFFYYSTFTFNLFSHSPFSFFFLLHPLLQ